jgi:hypothetical protein
MQNHAPTIYAYHDLPSLLQGESSGGRKTPLLDSPQQPVSERPDPK